MALNFLCFAHCSCSRVQRSAESNQPAQAFASRPFRAGAPRATSTAPGRVINGYFNDRIARHVHDELQARCLVLDDGKTRLAIAVCDSCMIPAKLMDAAKQLNPAARGHPRRSLCSSRHPHAHRAGCVSLLQSEAEATTRNSRRRMPTGSSAPRTIWRRQDWLGCGQRAEPGFQPALAHEAGTIRSIRSAAQHLVKMNPPVESPDLVEPAARPIRTFHSRVQSRKAGHLRCWELFAPLVGTSRGNDISADYYGAFCDRLQQLLGADRLDPPFVALLANARAATSTTSTSARNNRRKIHTSSSISWPTPLAREAHRVCQTLEFRDWAR